MDTKTTDTLTGADLERFHMHLAVQMAAHPNDPARAIAKAAASYIALDAMLRHGVEVTMDGVTTCVKQLVDGSVMVEIEVHAALAAQLEARLKTT